jgi:hypothetical protein
MLIQKDATRGGMDGVKTQSLNKYIIFGNKAHARKGEELAQSCVS